MHYFCKVPTKALQILFIVFFLAFLASGQVDAQLLDDTTSEKYGPKTTRYFLEKDIFHNIKRLHYLDTSLYDIEFSGDFARKSGRQLKDLGNLGTATEPIFFELPEQIGAYFGPTSFNPYAFQPPQLRYFSTQSPVTSVQYNIGVRGREIFRGLFSRNITPNLNVGFEYQRLTAVRNINLVQQRQFLADHHAFAGQANYVSPNRRYIAMGNFTHLNHLLYETGGILPKPGGTKDSLFNFELEKATLDMQTRNREKRNGWHMYQQYSLDSTGKLQVFHMFDRMRQVNRYTDEKANMTPGFYPDTVAGNFLFSLHTYTSFENKAGVKGRWGRFDYAAYYRRRDLRYISNHGVTSIPNAQENYLGGFLIGKVTDSLNLVAKAEINPTRDYLFSGQVSGSKFQAGFRQMGYSPTLQQSFFSAQILNWNTNFDLQNATHLWGSFTLKQRKWRFTPEVSVMNLFNQIYFSEDLTPKQAARSAQIIYLTANLELNLGKWHFHNRFRQTLQSGADVIRIPSQFYSGRFFYSRNIFGNRGISVETGLNLWWRDAWLGNNYMPLGMIWYLQNTANESFMLNSHFLIEPFVNLRIKRSFLYLRMYNANQGFGAPGYFTTPFYTGQKRIVEFGVNWQFFD